MKELWGLSFGRGGNKRRAQADLVLFRFVFSRLELSPSERTTRLRSPEESTRERRERSSRLVLVSLALLSFKRRKSDDKSRKLQS